jgi:hypothetical protein
MILFFDHVSSSFIWFLPQLRRLVAGLSQRGLGFMPRAVRVGFVVDKVALGQDLLQVEDCCLLGCSTVYSGRSLPTFQRSLLPPSSGRHRPDDGGSKDL